tara:strand:- start:102 stop:257 length:156 start_codon:yes stop_codon:yes gene_type:complete
MICIGHRTGKFDIVTPVVGTVWGLLMMPLLFKLVIIGLIGSAVGLGFLLGS